MDKLKDMMKARERGGGTFLIYGRPGVGKTELAAQFPKPLFLVDPQEDGIYDLMDLGTVPDVDVVTVEGWQMFDAVLDQLTASCEHKTIVLETLAGFEVMLHDYVLKSQGFKSRNDFDAYGRGPKISQRWMIGAIAKLQVIRNRGANIIITAHAKVKTMQNPMGDNYDCWIPECSQQTIEPIAKWMANIMFLTFDVRTQKANESDRKAKAIGGQDRILITGPGAGYEAKNRYGLPQELVCGESGAATYQILTQAIKAGRKS